MELDTHLFNLLQHYFSAGPNPAEKRRIEELALSHMESRKFMGRGTALRMWSSLINVLGVPSGARPAAEQNEPVVAWFKQDTAFGSWIECTPSESGAVRFESTTDASKRPSLTSAS